MSHGRRSLTTRKIQPTRKCGSGNHKRRRFVVISDFRPHFLARHPSSHSSIRNLYEDIHHGLAGCLTNGGCRVRASHGHGIRPDGGHPRLLPLRRRSGGGEPQRYDRILPLFFNHSDLQPCRDSNDAVSPFPFFFSLLRHGDRWHGCRSD